MSTPTTATVVAREASWLTTSGDSLPSLLTANDGPWDVILPYWPGAQLRTQVAGIYVTRGKILDQRSGNQRIRPSYAIKLKIHWPVKLASPGVSSIAAEEQQNLDDAVDLLLQRIRGPLGDKTHGGRFLSAGEAPGKAAVQVDFEDPEATIRPAKGLRASVSYSIDDLEVSD